MKSVALSLLAFLILSCATPAHAQIVRQDNTTLKFPGTAGPAGEYDLADLMPGIEFDRPVCVATPTGETRLFVIERVGRIWAIDDLNAPVKTLFLDITSKVHASSWVGDDRRTEGLSSIAFHPNFATNHRFFVTYNTITTTADGAGHHNRVAEYLADDSNSQAIPNSEIALITQFDEGNGHNINDLHFGPDGYLYIASGDEGDGGVGDDFNNAQKIDKDFFSAIMRIDVDKKAGNLTPNAHPASNQTAYKIPADNPFVGATSFNGIPVDPNKVRTEFFAVGLRNPWRFSFDPQTQKIYEGDVGQHSREEINLIVKGGNYGWSFKEGTVPGPKSGLAAAGFTSLAPIFEYDTDTYSHPGFSGYSVTGGVVYRGNAIPPLAGSLIFADYVTGNIWAMNVDAQTYPKPTRLLGETGIVGFGYDPRNGDILLVNHDAGKIRRLTYSSGVPANLPASIDQTGIFANLQSLTPNPGIYGYDVNVPLWSDGALKQRWFSIPASQKMKFAAETNWTFPTGSIWIKHFDLVTNTTNSTAKIRLETRVLVKTDGGVYGVTYKWDPRSIGAALVGDPGDMRQVQINDNGTIRTQIWRYPSRSECLTCHTAAGGRVLGFNTPQLNRDYGYGDITTNQIVALGGAGFLENPPAHAQPLRALAPLNDESASRTYRVRSYLFANCGQCHQPAAGIYADWDSRVTTPLTKAAIVWGSLQNNNGTGDKIVTPGSTNTSAIIKRMSSLGTERMPPLGTGVIDQEAVKLISDWIIQDLPDFQFYETWAAQYFPDGAPPRDEDADGDGVSNYAEYLMGTNPKTADTTPLASAAVEDGQVKLSFTHPANRAVFMESTDDLPANAWAPVQTPDNRLLFPAQSSTRTVVDALSSERRYYRVRVIEP
jgi:glucose/arabinose dehydrogenase/mono/diheme cytochrome c family protein